MNNKRKYLEFLESLKKEKDKAAKKGANNPYYLFYAAEYGKIKNIDIKLISKDTCKELQEGTEEFLKWYKYILLDGAKRKLQKGIKAYLLLLIKIQYTL